MKTIHVTNRSRELKDVLELAKQENIVVRTSDGDEFILSLIDDFDHEIAQQRQNKELMAFLDERLRKARAKPGIPLEQVKRQLGLKEEKKPREPQRNGRRKR